MATGSHAGSFAKGFIDSLLAVYKLKMMRDLYQQRFKHWDAQNNYWAQRGMNSGGAAGAKQRGLAAAEAAGEADPTVGMSGGSSGGASSSNPFVSRLVQIESNGENQISKTDKDSHGLTLAQGGNPNEISQGFFQIQNHPGGTWTKYAKAAGVDIGQYPTPRSAPYDVQWKVASQIPLEQWGDRTKQLLSRQFGNIDFSKPLGEFSSRYGDGETQATPKPPAGGYNATTSTGKTQPVDSQGRAIDPATSKPTARADTEDGVQVASMDDSAGLSEMLRLHPETANTSEPPGYINSTGAGFSPPDSRPITPTPVHPSAAPPAAPPAVPPAEINAPVRGGDERLRTAIPDTPQSNDQFIAIDAPNAPAESGGQQGRSSVNSPQLTALNLGWGPNPPISERAAPAAPPVSAPKGFDVAMDDYAKGGAVGFAAGGVSTYSPQQALADMNNMMGINGGATLQNIQSNYNAMSPSQQAWVNKTSDALRGMEGAGPTNTVFDTGTLGSGHQQYSISPDQAASNQSLSNLWASELSPYTAPAAAAPAAAAATAAAAPAPIVAPTYSKSSTPTNTIAPTDAASGGTTTGAYQLPNTTTPSASWAATDPGSTDFSNTTNKGGTNYSLGTDDILKGTTGFDDGGGVGPSAIGPPPGLAGGQQAIPPIYFNPATYSAAGAPVGRGVSRTSAPTYNAGAIPTLPMAQGGSVTRGVTGFDDGGPTDDEMAGGLQEDESGDMMINRQIEQDEAGQGAQAQAPIITDNPTDKTFSGYFTPASTQAAGGAGDSPPPGALPYTAQVKDDQGHPSGGFIDALASGLHWIGQHLGLIGGAQAAALPANAQQSQRNQAWAGGSLVMSPQQFKTINDMADPNEELRPYLRTINGMEQGHRFFLEQGDPASGAKMSASILATVTEIAANHGEAAARAYHDGHLEEAVRQLNFAAAALPTGERFSASMAPDGSHVIIQGSDLNERVLWKRYAAPQAILSAAHGFANKSIPWAMLENEAAKYDPTFSQMAKQRKANAQSDQDANVIRGWGNQTYTPVTPQGNAPVPRPAASPVTPPPVEASTAGAATPSVLPPAASPVTPAPVTPAPVTPAPVTPAPVTQESDVGAATPSVLPPAREPVIAQGDGGDNISPQVEANTRMGIHAKYFSNGMPINEDGSVTRPPPSVDQRQFAVMSPEVQAEWKRQDTTYREAVARNKEAEAREDQDYTTSLASQREARGRVAAANKQQETERFSQQEQNDRQKWAQDFEAEKIADARQNDLTKPRDENATRAAFSIAPNESGIVTGKEPTTYMAEALGLRTADGRPDIDALNKALSRSEQGAIQQALYSGYHFSPNQTASSVADLVTGLVTNPKYIGHPTKISNDKTYGVPRVSITVDRSNGTTGTLVLPMEDYKNLRAIADARTKANVPAPTQAPALPVMAPAVRPAASTPLGPSTNPRMGHETPPTSSPDWGWLLNPPKMPRGRGAIPPQ